MNSSDVDSVDLSEGDSALFFKVNNVVAGVWGMKATVGGVRSQNPLRNGEWRGLWWAGRGAALQSRWYSTLVGSWAAEMQPSTVWVVWSTEWKNDDDGI